MAQQSYFDFHFHPVFKQFLTHFEDDYPSTRNADEIIKPMDLKNDLLDLADEEVLHILESQCCLEQMQKGGVRLGIANVVAIEHGIADSEGFLAKLLKSNWTRPLDQRHMKSIRLGEVSYYRMFIKELDLYRTLAKRLDVEFLTRRNPVNIDHNSNKIFIALGMEGGHNLSRVKVAKSNVYDAQPANGISDAVYNDFCEQQPADVTSSLNRLQKALWKENMDLFYITLTHLSHIIEQPLATHAFGMKMLKHGAFYPVGNGITPLGKEVIEAAYTMSVVNDNETISTPILIDIKHMGLKSRQDLYELRRENKAYTNIPLIASHVGVTGYSIPEWLDALSKYAAFSQVGIQAVEIMTKRRKAGKWGSGLNDEFTFNPWSINLMDEDIVEVLNTGGMIGVSLDVRILGFQAKVGIGPKEQSEYLSVPDFKTFFPHLQVKGLASEPLESMETAESWLVPTKEERHPLCLCFNILHIISVAKAEFGKDLNPWEHICIGSDFDGLIDPVKICRDSSKMPDLEKVLIKWLPIAEKAYRKENLGPALLPKEVIENEDVSKLKEIVRGIMFDNGRKFLQKWVKGEFK